MSLICSNNCKFYSELPRIDDDCLPHCNIYQDLLRNFKLGSKKCLPTLFEALENTEFFEECSFKELLRKIKNNKNLADKLKIFLNTPDWRKNVKVFISEVLSKGSVVYAFYKFPEKSQKIAFCFVIFMFIYVNYKNKKAEKTLEKTIIKNIGQEIELLVWQLINA